MRSYIEHNREQVGYCQIQSEITLLPLTVPAYDSMGVEKRALLESIVRECIELAQTMFGKNKGDIVTISVPDFNLDDDRIWILLEERGEAYTMSLKMDVMNKDLPVRYQNTVEIRSNPRYGLRIGADKKIERIAIERLRYRIK